MSLEETAAILGGVKVKEKVTEGGARATHVDIMTGDDKAAEGLRMEVSEYQRYCGRRSSHRSSLGFKCTNVNQSFTPERIGINWMVLEAHALIY